LKKPQRITAEGIRIPFDKGRIKWAAGNDTEKKLAEIRSLVKDQRAFEITVTAHTSSSASVENDHELGRKRAWLVKKHLMDLGIEPDRIKTASKGSEMPEYENSAFGGNDRVEVEVRLNNGIQ
jgi:outer membrane protein OmpA-like peptidoglycan-associated protein